MEKGITWHQKRDCIIYRWWFKTRNSDNAWTGNKAIYVLTYEECRDVINSMKFGNSSSLFGNEKDDSFKGSIGAIYQSFSGEDVYPTLEEKV